MEYDQLKQNGFLVPFETQEEKQIKEKANFEEKQMKMAQGMDSSDYICHVVTAR